MIEGKRILVVEDEFIVAAMLCDTLEDHGAQPLGPVGRASDGLEMIAAGGIDAAVLDWNLAGESGAPLAEALSAQGIPFVIATGYGSVEPPFEDRPILGKPYVSAHLIEKLTGLFPV
ncbi:response regulator [Novosphingobium jiangmenense]|uniref:Response regulator n=1 Tax=Novosphingobium jiangmenense TaxID=2791981 RepID=A0ABS0HKR9_9SPHN|nr:response regulator [Novosphingobium jiangmenense]MBF9152574.1 response regulator [Novosphingobium jiangmenense]